MEIKFDSNQQFQIDAVNAIVDVFEGLPLGGEERFRLRSEIGGMFKGIEMTELGFGNNLTLTDADLFKNLHIVQERNGIDKITSLMGRNFSVEMETGTGKTYVYLRTIFELNQKYGFKKFVIVVPSVAIREGVLKNFAITERHFKNIYNNIPFSYAVYDSKKMSIVKNFALNNGLNILIINIDAFRKDFIEGGEDKGALFHRPSEKLNGHAPREYVQAAHPVVIIDEPQSVDTTPKAKFAINSLGPLCTLRYSATHREPYNLVYSLDPIKAYSMKLVKKISVASVVGEDDTRNAYIKLLAVDNRNGLKAKIEFYEKSGNGPVKKSKQVKQGDDLFKLSKQLEYYQDGFQVGELSAESGNEYVIFMPKGLKLMVGQECGGYGDDIKKLQIRKTVEEHLKKELQVKGRGIKVLSLFFIDRVNNYRSYAADGTAQKGKYALWFEEALQEFLAQKEYAGLLPFNLQEMHNGYFAQDTNGKWKDTRGDSQADEGTYDLIMKNKERLLSLEEPLRFIFSHSALREGWDNPNVFQICTLNETNAVVKKRQEIGRGMRIPVNQNGERVFDDAINKLVVMANESYESFAKKLQTEYEDDCGVMFGLLRKNSFIGITYEKGGIDCETGVKESEEIWENLLSNNYIDAQGKILEKFSVRDGASNLSIDSKYKNIKSEIFDIIAGYLIERHVTRYSEPRKIKINKEVYLNDDFKILWEKINKKTTYSVNYLTNELAVNCVREIKTSEKINPVRVQYIKADLGIGGPGVMATVVREQASELDAVQQFYPDILSYIQKETNLKRNTIFEILTKSGRLNDFKVNSQRFMDQAAQIIKRELSNLIVKGIKYEKIAGGEYEMQLFEQGEMVSYLEELLKTKKAVYNLTPYQSDVEKQFAEELEKRENIRLYVKLPNWFVVDTPVGSYNPDWAIVKEGDTKLYLVRETKGSKNYSDLRGNEASKIKCGQKHFEELGVDYKVVTNIDEL